MGCNDAPSLIVRDIKITSAFASHHLHALDLLCSRYAILID
jgi:hypothetical protein